MSFIYNAELATDILGDNAATKDGGNMPYSPFINEI